jgi:tRNA-splicing ligase RtcB
MFRVIYEPERGQRVPVRLWARRAAADTVRQLQRLASQPYVVEFVAGMADAHVSEGVAVGSVFATERIVVPGALGGDLGCGMSARRIASDGGGLERRELEAVIAALERAIPAGDATHTGHGVQVPDDLLTPPLSTSSLEHTREALSRRHLGTLGGGNHFIELDRDADGGLWLLVHSGSRGLGSAIAHHHAKAAAAAHADDLPGLDVEAAGGAAYVRDLAWALEFARENRRTLEARAVEVIGNVLSTGVVPEEGIDIHHNFVARETWNGRDLLVHRKGAVSIPEGTMALIPGSMGTASYVVEGLGAPDSFGSCSHGAGRVMTRKEARARVRTRALADAMRRVVYPEHLLRQLVEEAPSAYRDITEVLEDQKDLVRRRVRLEPVAVLKG